MLPASATVAVGAALACKHRCGRHTGASNLDGEADTDQPEGELFECSGCGSWGHLGCYPHYASRQRAEEEAGEAVVGEATAGGEAAAGGGGEAAMHCVRCTDAWRDREQAGVEAAALCIPACSPRCARPQPCVPRLQPCVSHAGGVELLMRVWAQRGRHGSLLRGAFGADVRVPQPRGVEPATLLVRGCNPVGESLQPHVAEAATLFIQVPRLQSLGAHRVLCRLQRARPTCNPSLLAC